MKILQLNAWTGRIKDGLTRFIAEGDFDVVCLQEAIWSDNCSNYLEMYIDTVEKIQRATGYKYVFKSSNYGTRTLDGRQFEVGNAILSKIPFKGTEEHVVFGEYEVAKSLDKCQSAIAKHRYTTQAVVLDNDIAVVNYHGYWRKDPLGCKEAEECMEKVADIIKAHGLPVIMCGDLNVISEAPAMRKLDFLQDLTAKNEIKTTLRNLRFVKDVACDHILISKGLNCEKFEVIDAPVSDHRALIAEIKQK